MSKVLRLEMDSSVYDAEPTDHRTGEGLFFIAGDDLDIQCGFFRDGALDTALNSVTCSLIDKPAGASFWSVTLTSGLNTSLTVENWRAETDQFCTFAIPGADTGITAGSSYLLVIDALDTSGDKTTFLAGKIRVIDSGTAASTISSPGDTQYYSATVSDSRYARKSLEAEVAALTTSAGVPLTTEKSKLLSGLSSGTNSSGDTIFGFVYDDTTSTNNGLYYKEDGSSTWNLSPGSDSAQLLTAQTDIDALEVKTENFYSQQLLTDGVYGLIIDAVGKLILGQRSSTGSLVGPGIHETIKAVYPQNPNDLIVVDSSTPPKILFDSRADTTSGPTTALPAAAKVYDLEIIVFYGQSNARGIGGTPVIHRTADSYHLGPTTNAVTLITGDGTVGPLTENEVGTGNGGEVGVLALTERLDQEWNDNYSIPGAAPRYLVFSAGVSSSTYQQLKKTTTPYNNLIASLTAAFNYATTRGLSCGCRAVFWNQGESHNSETQAQQTANLQTLQGDLDTDIKAVTSQSEDVHLFSMQVSGDTTTETAAEDCALGQLDADETNSGTIHIVSPTYGTEHVYADGVHFNAIGHSYHAWQFAESYIDEFVGGTHYSLKPTSASGSGSIVTVNFTGKSENLPIWVDTVTFAKVTDFGFKITDGTGDLTVDDIDVYDGQVKINCNRSLTAGSVTVRYALDYKRSDEPLTNAGAGNLRDSNPTVMTIDGIRVPLWRWVPAFEETFTA